MISDKEIGELIGNVKSLKETVAHERDSNNVAFIKLHDKLDSFITMFQSWSRNTEERIKIDYKYLDTKIGDENSKLEYRIIQLENFKDGIDKASKHKNDGLFSHIKKTAITVLVTSATLLIIGVFVYLLLEYIKNGGKP